MAFIGMVYSGIFITVLLIVYAVLGISALALVIIGIILLRKHRIAAVVMFIIAVLNVTGIVVSFNFIVSPKPFTQETRDGGRVTIYPEDWSAMHSAVENRSSERIGELLDKHPELLYFYDQNRVSIIEYGLYNLDTDMMRVALDHGAVFDDPLRYKNSTLYSSLESFYRCLYYPDEERSPLYEAGAVTDEMIEAVRFAIENGAEIIYDQNSYKLTEHNPHNFYETTLLWVYKDDKISEKDEKLLSLVESCMPDDWSRDSIYERNWAGRKYLDK